MVPSVSTALSYLGPLVLWSKLKSTLRASESLNNIKHEIRKLDLSSLIENNSNCDVLHFLVRKGSRASPARRY